MKEKKNWFMLSQRAIDNLMVVLIAILFYLGISNFDIVREKIAAFLNVVSPFIAGFVIAYLLNAPTKFLETKIFYPLKRRRMLAILSAYMLALATLSILLNLILPQVWASAMELVNKMPIYLAGLNNLAQALTTSLHMDGEGITDLVLSYQDIMKRVSDEVAKALPQLWDFGVAIGSGLVNVLLTGVTAFIASVYMLSSKGRLVAQMKKLIYALIPTEKANRFLGICSYANRIFVGFINGKIIDSAIIGVLCFILNLLLRIPYNILIAVVIGVTNIIPFFGPIIGAVPCVMILLIVDPWAALRFTVLVIALQQFDGNILGPKILGDSTGLSAIWVLVAIIVGGGLFGFPGMLLGVPTFAVVYALVREWTEQRLASKGIDASGKPIQH